MKKKALIITIFCISILIGFAGMVVRGAHTRSRATITTQSLEKIKRPKLYTTTFLEHNGATRVLTLSLYPDNSATLVTDPDISPQSMVPHQEELGSWKLSNDNTQIVVTLTDNLLGGEKILYTKPAIFRFIQTETGIEAIEYDHDRYPYSFLNFIPT